MIKLGGPKYMGAKLVIPGWFHQLIKTLPLRETFSILQKDTHKVDSTLFWLGFGEFDTLSQVENGERRMEILRSPKRHSQSRLYSVQVSVRPKPDLG